MRKRLTAVITFVADALVGRGAMSGRVFSGVKILLLSAIVVSGTLVVFGQKRVKRQPARYVLTGCRQALPTGPGQVPGGVLNRKAVSLPDPVYPEAARAARADGSVVVQVLVDESGNVISASAASGNPLLRAGAVAAARKAKLSPTKLSGQPVRVWGLLVYNFTAPPL